MLLLHMVILPVLWGGVCRADRSIRCDGRIVSIGAFREEVAAKCGEADHVEAWEEGPRTVYSQLFDYEREHYILPHLIYGPLQMERWTYDFGSNRLIHYLYFQNGKLIRIETGGRGTP